MTFRHHIQNKGFTEIVLDIVGTALVAKTETFLPILFWLHLLAALVWPRAMQYNFHSMLIKTRIIENWLLSQALDKLIVLFQKENIYFSTDFLTAQTVGL